MEEGTLPELTNVRLELLTEAAVQQLQLLAALQQLLHNNHIEEGLFCDSTTTLKGLSHKLNNYFEYLKSKCLLSSVADTDPYDSFFGPPESGSISQRYGSGSRSFYHQTKIVRKNSDSYCFVTSP
jgi:hypothetical protein